MRGLDSALLRADIRRAFTNMSFFVAMIISCGLALWSAGLAITSYLEWQALSDGVGWVTSQEWVGSTITGAFASWMVVGAGDPFVSGMFFFVMPLLCLMPYAWSLEDDERTGYIAHLRTRFGNIPILVSRYLAVFLSSGAVVSIPLVLNIIVLAPFMPLNQPDVTTNLYLGISAQELWAHEFFSNPVLYIVLNTALDFVLCGFWGCLMMSISLYVRNRVVLITCPLVITAVFRLVNNYVFDVFDVNGFRFNLTDLLYQSALTYWRTAVPTACFVALLAIASALLVLSHRNREWL